MKDLISRQAAIDAIGEKSDEIYKTKQKGATYPHDDFFQGMAYAENVVKNLPSAEKPFKMPEIYVAEGFDTVADEDGNIGFGVYVPDENQIYVAGDVEDEIRARALLHEVCHWVQDMCGRPFDEDEANEFSDIVYDDLPSAQPESKKGEWIEAYDPFNRISGRCSICGWEAHLYEDDVVGMNYCPNCGTRMEGEIE